MHRVSAPTRRQRGVEVKFRAPQRRELMHRLDGKLQQLDAQLKAGPRGQEKRRERRRLGAFWASAVFLGGTDGMDESEEREWSTGFQSFLGAKDGYA